MYILSVLLFQCSDTYLKVPLIPKDYLTKANIGLGCCVIPLGNFLFKWFQEGILTALITYVLPPSQKKYELNISIYISHKVTRVITRTIFAEKPN